MNAFKVLIVMVFSFNMTLAIAADNICCNPEGKKMFKMFDKCIAKKKSKRSKCSKKFKKRSTAYAICMERAWSKGWLGELEKGESISDTFVEMENVCNRSLGRLPKAMSLYLGYDFFK